MTRGVPILAVPALLLWTIAWWMTESTRYRPPEQQSTGLVGAIREHVATVAAGFGGDGGGLLPGLILGDTSGIPASLAEAMRITSLTHLSAVSGANCAVVIGLSFGVAAIFGAPIAVRLGVSALALGGFVLLVGPDASVVRAALMAVVALAAAAAGRTVAGITALCIAIIVALLIEPTLSHSLGFALSVSATLGLLVLARPLAERLQRWLPRTLSLGLSVPIAASIACQPLIVLVAPFVPTYGIIANALAEPLVPIITVLGMLAVAAMPLGWVSTGLLGVAWTLATIIATLARTFAALPCARIPWPVGVLGFVLATCISISVGSVILGRGGALVPWMGVLAVVLGLALTVGGGAVSWLSAPRDWSWAECDVGQGDAVVVRDSGRVAVIDVGREEAPIRECLARLGIGHIDLLVLTHFDVDHVGGVGTVYGRVGTVLHGPTDGIADETILHILQARGASLVTAERGVSGTLGRLDWAVEWPTSAIPVEPGNPASVTVRFSSSSRCDATCIDGIDLGDLPAAQQARLRGLGAVGPATIVKVSHHGSRDQDPEFYRLLHPLVAFIGVGADNDYGHPTPFALDLVQSATVARTDLNGLALVARTTSGQVAVWRERGGG